MKTFVCCVFMLFCTGYSFAQSTDTLGLSKVVNSISVCIEKNDFSGLKKMIKHGDFFTETIFENMKIVHSTINYRKLYFDSQKGPVYEKEKYILGGHGEATGHINIELRYIGKKWQLYKVWVCR